MHKFFCSYPLLLATLMVCLASLCSGQDRPVRILYYNAPSGAPTEAYLYADKGLLGKTDLPRSNFSETFEVPRGPLKLRFLSRPLGADEKMPKRAPVVTIPKGWRKVLLLVFEDPGNPFMPIRLQAINASDDVFGPGSLYMVNFSEIGVAGTVGNKELKLKPKSIQIVKNPIDENGYYPAKLDAYIGSGQKPRRFIKQMWQHSDTTRQVLFIMPKPAPRYATYYCAPVEDF